MSTTELEQRLIAVERDVAQLKAERRTSHPVAALERIHGTFEDDASFREAARLGRKWRNSQRPSTTGKSRARKK
jgi:hypothetical protein